MPASDPAETIVSERIDARNGCVETALVDGLPSWVWLRVTHNDLAVALPLNRAQVDLLITSLQRLKSSLPQPALGELINQGHWQTMADGTERFVP